MLTIRDIKRAEEYGVSANLIRQRMKRGMSKEKAITTPNYYSETNKWRKVAEQNGISRNVFYNRIYRDGWDFERASSQPVQQETDFRKWKQVAISNGISPDTYSSRVHKMGMDYETAATTPLKSERYKEFRKWQGIANQNGIGNITFNKRVREYGWSLEKAATTPVNTKFRRKSG